MSLRLHVVTNNLSVIAPVPVRCDLGIAEGNTIASQSFDMLKPQDLAILMNSKQPRLSNSFRANQSEMRCGPHKLHNVAEVRCDA